MRQTASPAAAGTALAIPAAAAPAASRNAPQGRLLALVDAHDRAAAPGALHVIPIGYGAQQVKPVGALGALVIIYGHGSSGAKNSAISLSQDLLYMTRRLQASLFTWLLPEQNLSVHADTGLLRKI